jgi:BRCT domain type II-containing protein
MEATAIKAGASITKSITQKTTILVVADLNTTLAPISSKMVKAQELGIDMISPKAFFEMCDSINVPPNAEKRGTYITKHIKSCTRFCTKKDLDEFIPQEPPKPVVKKKKYSNSRRIEL